MTGSLTRIGRLQTFASIGAFALTLAGVTTAAPAAERAMPTTNVTLTERGARLSTERVEIGTVRFVVRNAATVPRSFWLGGRRTKTLRPRARQSLVVNLARPGLYRWTVRTAAGRVARRGTLLAVAPAAPAAAVSLVGRVGMPTDIDAPPADVRRLVVTEQSGLAHLFVDGEQQAAPFLDLREQVAARGEDGLLSIAFHPEYATNGLTYVFYNDIFSNINVAEYRRDEADPNRLAPASARVIFHRVKFAPGHNGGMLQFGPDGALYVSIGDGGLSPDAGPGAFVQAPETPWGKILRLDPTTGDVTVFATGLRNPWRFWIDRATSDLYIADVGHDRREEIDVVPGLSPGLNFGWPCFEGTLFFDSAATCSASSPPIYEYAHGAGACSITGGVVARDPRLPELAGSFLFGDLCGTKVRRLRLSPEGVSVADVADVGKAITFGVDSADRIYVGSAGGEIYRLDPRPAREGARARASRQGGT